MAERFVDMLDGSERWYLDKKLHREDGPAIVSKEHAVWYLHGKIHREDGPAVQGPNGVEMWFKHGKRHREGGFAVKRECGAMEWWVDGNRHREDGPAIDDFVVGFKAWYLNGEEMTENEWKECTTLLVKGINK